MTSVGDGAARGGSLAADARRALATATARAALLFVAATIALACAADVVASGLPLAAHLGGRLYVLPALSPPAALRDHELTELRASLGPGDWMLEPLVPWGPNTQDKGHRALEAPSRRHWLGTDTSRRDVLARLVHGTRLALAVGLGAVAVYILVGTLAGVAAGYFGGAVDMLISRLIEVLLAVPGYFILLAVMALTEGGGAGTIIIVLGLVGWTHVARLTRAEARRVRQLEFVRAAEALGLGSARVLFRHVLPNSLAPAIVTAAFGVAAAILTEASLSFLGFGVPDATASWGGIMHGALVDFGAWWLIAFPGLALFGTVCAYNVLGDALRAALDPRCGGPPQPWSLN
jgi:peptide/nickel transport system permease protein